MTVDEFWNGLPILAAIYREKHRLEMEQQNQILWMQGFYICEGFSAVISNAFSKRGGKKAEYPKEPYNIFSHGKKEDEEKEKEKMVEDFKSQLERLGRKFEAKHKREQQGGENLDSRKP